MPQIRPIRDLRDTSTMSDLCHKSQEPIFITKNGYGDMVLMSMECYEKMLETKATDEAIREAEEEYNANAILVDAREALGSLREKHFG